MSALKRTLFFSEGSSDKVYEIELVPAADGLFHVMCRNGRRGGPLKDQPKTASPLPLDKATALADKIEAEKRRKGYTPSEDGVPYALTEKAGEVSGWLPCLPTPIPPERVPEYVADGGFACQPKMDGERRAVEIAGGCVRGINRKGLYVSVPQPWVEPLSALPDGTLLDGEHVGDVLYVFDAVKIGGRDLTGLPFARREAELQKALAGVGAGGAVKLVPSARGAAAKEALIEQLREAHQEGVVFRCDDAPYRPGAAAGESSACLTKYKFLETASCIVKAVNGTRRSVSLCVLDDQGNEVPVGNVTIPANHDVPPVGAVADVRFLYLFEAGSLFQPVYLGQRHDQSREDALLSKIVRIRRKADPANDDASEDEAQAA